MGDCRGRDRLRAEEVVLPLAERSPRLDLHAVRGRPVGDLALLVGGVQLDLVDRRGHPGGRDDLLQVRHEEVRHSDAAGEPGIPQLDELLPRVQVVVARRGGPVHQVEVDLVEPELVEALRERRRGLVAVVAVVPQLRRDEEIAAGQPLAAMAAPTPAFVP